MSQQVRSLKMAFLPLIIHNLPSFECTFFIKPFTLANLNEFDHLLFNYEMNSIDCWLYCLADWIVIMHNYHYRLDASVEKYLGTVQRVSGDMIASKS